MCERVSLRWYDWRGDMLVPVLAVFDCAEALQFGVCIGVSGVASVKGEVYVVEDVEETYSPADYAGLIGWIVHVVEICGRVA